MTRKDYRILATALGTAGKMLGQTAWEATLDIMCRALGNNYANFDRVKFEDAANLTRNTINEEATQ